MKFDPQLLQKTRQGDRLAQGQLYRACYPILLSVCLRYLKNKEESVEMMNLIFLKILTHIPQFPTEGNFTKWICRIAINTLIDDFRRKKTSKVQFELSDSFEHNLPVAETTIEIVNQLDAEYLEELIQQLPPMYQQVFNLFAIDGYAHAEIAQMLNIPEGTSKWYLNKARIKLQKMLKREPEFQKNLSSNF